jgi:hypothetical protein
MRKILISDFTIKEAPHGGSEWVNQVLIDKFNLEFQYSQNVSSFDKDAFYIISNVSLMNPDLVRRISNLNYIIIENDYKICHSRHPWRWENSIVPLNERTNYDIYANAKAIFVQTNDHLNVYKTNDVKGHFINLHCSIWAEDDLVLLEGLLNKNKIKNGAAGIYDTTNWIKNTQGTIEYCKENNLPFTLIPNMEKREDFLQLIAECSKLIFFPIARETFCRLVVEAKCLGLEVVTTKNYGASLEGWFDMKGQDLIDFLRNQTENNINKISKFL